MSQITFNIRDNSDEYSPVAFNIVDVDETSWVATDAAIATLQAAIAALINGNIASKTLTAYREPVNDVRPVSKYSQREVGLRLYYKDDVTAKTHFVTIASPDLNLVAEQGTDKVDLEEPLLAAVKTAIEAVAVSPAGNSITIDAGYVVGRKS